MCRTGELLKIQLNCFSSCFWEKECSNDSKYLPLNSHFSMQKDTPVLEIELDVDEMARRHKT